MKPNLLDRALAGLAPGWAQRRLRHRLMYQALQDQLERREHRLRYEAATHGRRTSGWRTGTVSPADETGNALAILRDRSRDMTRNNGWASKALRVLTANVIGTGIMAKYSGTSQAETDRYRGAWTDWAETTEPDPERRLDFYGIQALAFREAMESGEALIRRRWRRAEDRLTVPLQLELLEGDHLDLAKNQDQTASQPKIVHGVEYDRLGRRAAYWLHPEHPGSTYGGFGNLSRRVDAADVIHLFRVDRIGQNRGVPIGAPVLLRARDLDDYEDAQLLRQKLAACYVAFVFSQDAEAELATHGTARTADTNEPVEELAPGIVRYLNPGEDVRFGNPPAVEGYAEYLSAGLRNVAAGYGVTYESLSGDLKSVSFSAGRMGWLDFAREVDAFQWLTVIPQLCGPVARWFMEAAQVAGVTRSTGRVTWTTPRREMIDPTKEIPALNRAIRSGILSRSEVVRTFGYDPAELLEEMRQDAAELDAAGLLLDSDPRHDTGRATAAA